MELSDIYNEKLNNKFDDKRRENGIKWKFGEMFKEISISGKRGEVVIEGKQLEKVMTG